MPSATRRRLPGWLVVALVLGALVLLWGLTRPDDGDVGAGPQAVGSTSSASATGSSSRPPTPDSGLPSVAESSLPREAVAMLALILAGGPFPYEEDGGTFGNRERLLPARPSGYYREYTVATPGAGDRGPRRIIGGADGDLYWTTDHYASFHQIEEGR